MNIIEKLQEGAKKTKRRIILPETWDERILRAAAVAVAENLADIYLLGDPTAIKEKAKELKISLVGAHILDSQDPQLLQKAADHYYERRKLKDATPEKSLRIMTEQPIYLAAALVGIGEVDGMVAGADTATEKVIKSGIYCIGLAEGCRLVSSYFIMVTNDKTMGEKGAFFFADCGVNPNPNAEQLADIAMSTANSFRAVMNAEPRVAMLSFSTHGSANHPDVGKVTSALSIAKLKYPELIIDGELQLDAAIIPDVAQRKAPDSVVKGTANVLIFPDLDSGNIGYKLVERFGKVKAFGPIIQGMSKPINDLSRGCNVDDVVSVIEITAVSVKKG